MFHTTKKFILEVSIPIANPVLILTKQMKIAFLNICLTVALSAILMDGGIVNSDPVRSLDEIIKQSEADCKFLFESNESKSFRDHARPRPSVEL